MEVGSVAVSSEGGSAVFYGCKSDGSFPRRFSVSEKPLTRALSTLMGRAFSGES